eukprot:m.1423857 g.1423857  ORF g.1423857 m.1423857 type:complete len:1504 (-) comp25057_c0_seq2:135-4646(-)
MLYTMRSCVACATIICVKPYFTKMLTFCDSFVNQIDLAFVIDSSSSVSLTNWGVQLNFVSDFVSQIPSVGPADARVAHVTFATTARVDFDYNDFTTASAIENEVISLQHMGGNTHLGNALQLVASNLQQSSAGYRGSNSIVVIVTDGQPTDSVTAAVSALTALNTDIYAITIGSWATDAIVATIVNGPIADRVQRLSSFSELSSASFVNDIVNQTVCDGDATSTTTLSTVTFTTQTNTATTTITGTAAPATAAPTQAPSSRPPTRAPTIAVCVDTATFDCSTQVALCSFASVVGVCPRTCGACTVAPTTPPGQSTAAPTSRAPSNPPTTRAPTRVPTTFPTTPNPTAAPTDAPTTMGPTGSPTSVPTTISPTQSPTRIPTTRVPTPIPTTAPTSAAPTTQPSITPTARPSISPTTSVPSLSPTSNAPTTTPTQVPTTATPTSSIPTDVPSRAPVTSAPSLSPTGNPGTPAPTLAPTSRPSVDPTNIPTSSPNNAPSSMPPSLAPTAAPLVGTLAPSLVPTMVPSTASPTFPAGSPTTTPTTLSPSSEPTYTPTMLPSHLPTTVPSAPPVLSNSPTSAAPTSAPTSGAPTISSTTPGVALPLGSTTTTTQHVATTSSAGGGAVLGGGGTTTTTTLVTGSTTQVGGLLFNQLGTVGPANNVQAATGSNGGGNDDLMFLLLLLLPCGFLIRAGRPPEEIAKGSAEFELVDVWPPENSEISTMNPTTVLFLDGENPRNPRESIVDCDAYEAAGLAQMPQTLEPGDSDAVVHSNVEFAGAAVVTSVNAPTPIGVVSGKAPRRGVPLVPGHVAMDEDDIMLPAVSATSTRTMAPPQELFVAQNPSFANVPSDAVANGVQPAVLQPGGVPEGVVAAMPVVVSEEEDPSEFDEGADEVDPNLSSYLQILSDKMANRFSLMLDDNTGSVRLKSVRKTNPLMALAVKNAQASALDEEMDAMHSLDNPVFAVSGSSAGEENPGGLGALQRTGIQFAERAHAQGGTVGTFASPNDTLVRGARAMPTSGAIKGAADPAEMSSLSNTETLPQGSPPPTNDSTFNPSTTTVSTAHMASQPTNGVATSVDPTSATQPLANGALCTAPSDSGNVPSSDAPPSATSWGATQGGVPLDEYMATDASPEPGNALRLSQTPPQEEYVTVGGNRSSSSPQTAQTKGNVNSDYLAFNSTTVEPRMATLGTQELDGVTEEYLAFDGRPQQTAHASSHQGVSPFADEEYLALDGKRPFPSEMSVTAQNGPWPHEDYIALDGKVAHMTSANRPSIEGDDNEAYMQFGDSSTSVMTAMKASQDMELDDVDESAWNAADAPPVNRALKRAQPTLTDEYLACDEDTRPNAHTQEEYLSLDREPQDYVDVNGHDSNGSVHRAQKATSPSYGEEEYIAINGKGARDKQNGAHFAEVRTNGAEMDEEYIDVKSKHPPVHAARKGLHAEEGEEYIAVNGKSMRHGRGIPEFSAEEETNSGAGENWDATHRLDSHVSTAKRVHQPPMNVLIDVENDV